MNKLFDKACIYAIEKHSCQKRKDGTLYILHPFEVASIANTITKDEEVLSAAILHDVCEECNIDTNEIRNLFGERVGKIVSLETEKKYQNLSKKDSWKLRKEEAIKRLKETDEIGFKIVYLSDKLANIRSLFIDYKCNGKEAFYKFNVTNIEEQAWYYYSILDAIRDLNNTDAYKEYKEKIDIIFKNNGKD